MSNSMWVSGGKTYPIAEMSDRHLTNAIKLFTRRLNDPAELMTPQKRALMQGKLSRLHEEENRRHKLGISVAEGDYEHHKGHSGKPGLPRRRRARKAPEPVRDPGDDIIEFASESRKAMIVSLKNGKSVRQDQIWKLRQKVVELETEIEGIDKKLAVLNAAEERAFKEPAIDKAAIESSLEAADAAMDALADVV